MQKYKVDWLAFSVRCDDEKAENTLDENILNLLGYQFSEFEPTSGKNFYDTGATIGNYVNIFWNEKNNNQNRPNKNDTMACVFTGQGATDLAIRNNNDWVKILKTLMDYQSKVNITRIDLALDDFSETVSFDKIEKKLKKGHYRSSKRSYNIIKTSDKEGRPLGTTIYLGSARSSGGRGNWFGRFYDKRAQYISKNQLVPTEIRDFWEKQGKESWQRYEISYSKRYTDDIVQDIINGESIDKIFKTSLRDLLEILTPRGKDSNTRRWYKTSWWEDFLQYDERKTFSLAERDVMLADTFEWLRVSVLPTLNILEQIGNEVGFDVYDLLRNAKKLNQVSKKQHRMIADSRTIDSETLNDYLKKFLTGKKVEDLRIKEEVNENGKDL